MLLWVWLSTALCGCMKVNIQHLITWKEATEGLLKMNAMDKLDLIY